MDIDPSFLLAYDDWIRLAHVAGSIIAIGAVVATDLVLLWLKFNPRQAPLVARISSILSLQVWIGFLLLSVSGLLLFLPRTELAGLPIFQLKMLLVAVVFLNGLLLNFWIAPKFEKIAPTWHQQTKQVKRFTYVAGVAAAISLIGWWSIVVLMTVFY